MNNNNDNKTVEFNLMINLQKTEVPLLNRIGQFVDITFISSSPLSQDVEIILGRI